MWTSARRAARAGGLAAKGRAGRAVSAKTLTRRPLVATTKAGGAGVRPRRLAAAVIAEPAFTEAALRRAIDQTAYRSG